MEFRNYIEELVLEELTVLLEKRKGICKCERCRLDIAALALNNLPPRYVVTDIGRAHTKLESVKTQFKIDVIKELTKAIAKVKKRPRHVKRKRR